MGCETQEFSASKIKSWNSTESGCPPEMFTWQSPKTYKTRITPTQRKEGKHFDFIDTGNEVNTSCWHHFCWSWHLLINQFQPSYQQNTVLINSGDRKSFKLQVHELIEEARILITSLKHYFFRVRCAWFCFGQICQITWFNPDSYLVPAWSCWNIEPCSEKDCRDSCL